MLPELTANVFQTTLNGAIAAGAVALDVNDSPPASLAPVTPWGGQFVALIDAEYFLVTAVGSTGNKHWTVVPGQEDSAQAAHASGATVTVLVTRDALGLYADPLGHQQRDGNGMLASSCDSLSVGAAITPSSGFIYMARIWVPRSISVTSMVVYVTAAGVTLTAGQNLAGLYDPTDGSLIAQTADQSSAWTTALTKVMALTPQAGKSLTPLPGGVGKWYWGAILARGTTPPKFAAQSSNMILHPGRQSSNVYSATVPGAKHRGGYESVGGRTSLLSLNGLTISDSSMVNLPWIGLT